MYEEKWIKTSPDTTFPVQNKIDNCGEPEQFQERLSSHKATAPQPILDMS